MNNYNETISKINKNDSNFFFDEILKKRIVTFLATPNNWTWPSRPGDGTSGWSSISTLISDWASDWSSVWTVVCDSIIDVLLIFESYQKFKWLFSFYKNNSINH